MTNAVTATPNQPPCLVAGVSQPLSTGVDIYHDILSHVYCLVNLED